MPRKGRAERRKKNLTIPDPHDRGEDNMVIGKWLQSLYNKYTELNIRICLAFT
jgi:hypothetical protein